MKPLKRVFLWISLVVYVIVAVAGTVAFVRTTSLSTVSRGLIVICSGFFLIFPIGLLVFALVAKVEVWAYGTRFLRQQRQHMRARIGGWNEAFKKNLAIQLVVFLTLVFCQFCMYLGYNEEGVSLARRMKWDMVWLTKGAIWLPAVLCFPVCMAALRRGLEMAEINNDAVIRGVLEVIAGARMRCASHLAYLVELDTSRGRKSSRKELLQDGMGHIADHIHHVFTTMASKTGVEIKVTILSVEDGKIDSRVAAAPRKRGIESRIEDIRNPNSAASHGLRDDLFLIEDVALEILKGEASHFVKSQSNPKGATGCLLVYPIRSTLDGKPLYVVCVHANEPNVFLEGNKARYRAEFDLFGAHALQLGAYAAEVTI